MMVCRLESCNLLASRGNRGGDDKQMSYTEELEKTTEME